MTPLDNREGDWDEYRQLFLADRAANRKFQDDVLKQLIDMNASIVELRAERRVGGWILGLVVPAIVAALISFGVKL